MNQLRFVKSTTCAAVLALVFVGLGVMPVSATTATTPLAVSASVVASCTINAGALSFGAYTGASAVTAQATLTANCTNAAPYSVALDKGAGSGASITTRKLTASGGTLNYSLYQDAGFATLWGDGTTGTQASGTGTGVNQTITVYGQIPGSQAVTVGSYVDTVTATITY
jgi:spore coat protein U-like protein